MGRLLSLFFFIIPFQWALGLGADIDLAVIRLFALGLVLLWLAFGLSSRHSLVPIRLPSFLLSAFLFWAVCSVAWSGNTTFALRKALFLLSFLPIFFVLSAWFQEHVRERIVFLSSFVYGAFLAALFGIVIFFCQFIFGVEAVLVFLTHSILPIFLGTAFGQSVVEYPSFLVNVSGNTLLRASGPFPDPHMFSLYIGMAIPFAGISALRAVSRKKIWQAIFVILLLADMLSFSRGGYVALAISAVFFLFVFSPLPRISWQQVLSALGVGLIFFPLFFLSPIGSRFLSSFSQVDGSNQERVRLWWEAAGYIMERPLFGTGIGNYSLLVKPSASYREPIYAHNLYLDTAAELGLVGLTFFCTLVGLSLSRAWGAWKKTQNTHALAVVLALVIFMVHSLFETPLYSVHILPVLLLFLASGVSYKHEDFSA